MITRNTINLDVLDSKGLILFDGCDIEFWECSMNSVLLITKDVWIDSLKMGLNSLCCKNRQGSANQSPRDVSKVINPSNRVLMFMSNQ